MSHGWLRRLRSGGVGLAFALGLLTAGVFHLPYQTAAQQQGAAYTATSTSNRDAPAGAATLQSLSESFASVAEHVKPSVVYIKSGRTNQTARNAPRITVS